MFKLMGKEINAVLGAQKIFMWTLKLTRMLISKRKKVFTQYYLTTSIRQWRPSAFRGYCFFS